MRKWGLVLLGLCSVLVGFQGALAQTSFEGVLQIIYGDAESLDQGWEVYSLSTADGASYNVEALPGAFQASPDSLRGARVRIHGVERDGTIHAARVERAQGGSGSASGSGEVWAITGSTPWRVLLCKYSDIATEPNPLSYYTSLMDGTYPRMDHYWKAQSYNLINLTGTTAHNWLTLPQTQAFYTNPANTDFTNLMNLWDACTAAHNASVNFATAHGVIIMVNGTVTGGAGGWGGFSDSRTLDGVTKFWPSTWMPRNPSTCCHWPGVLGHEMGHGYGLPHSSAQPYTDGSGNQDYQSDWDVMSSGFFNAGATYAPYEQAGTGTVSYHKDKLGWVSAAQKFTPASGTTTDIVLWPLGDGAPPGSQRLMAQLPIPSSTHYYTVEARRKRAQPYYDFGLPSEGVVIHEVDPDSGVAGRPADALVVDLDGDYTANPDPGEVWLVGETFQAPGQNIAVSVLSANADGSFNVRISYLAAGVNVAHTGGSTTVTEGGATDTYTIVLNSQPTASVSVTPANAAGQVSLSGAVTFTTLNWNVAQSVTVTAINDTIGETSPLSTTITHTSSSTDPLYSGISVPSLTASVLDNDPIASVSPAGGINFGNQTVNLQSASQNVTMTNIGSGSMTVSGAAIGGANPGDFLETADACTGAVLAPSGSCIVSVAMKATTTGSRTATLTFTHSATGSPTSVPLSGVGVLPEINLSTTALSFGSINIGQTSGNQTMQIQNLGLGSLVLGTITKSGANPGDFNVSGCSGATVAAGSSCVLTVSFSPTATGGRSATINIPSNDTDEPLVTVSLSGTGILAPVVSLSRTSIPFGSIELGTTSGVQTVTVTNTGGSNLLISNVTITGTFAANFSRSGCIGVTVAPGGSCTISTTFTPGALGSHTANLQILTNANPTTYNLPLSGTGVDTTPPGGFWNTGSGAVLIGGVSRVEGTATDAGSGIATSNGARVWFRPLVGAETAAAMQPLVCNTGRTSCTFSATAPLIPGLYTARFVIKDAAGNEFTTGPTISVIVI